MPDPLATIRETNKELIVDATKQLTNTLFGKKEDLSKQTKEYYEKNCLEN